MTTGSFGDAEGLRRWVRIPPLWHFQTPALIPLQGGYRSCPDGSSVRSPRHVLQQALLKHELNSEAFLQLCVEQGPVLLKVTGDSV